MTIIYPIKTSTTNGVLTGSGDVRDLPVTNLQYPDGTPAVESVWELTDEEVQRIVETKRLYFLCLGRTHPPILPKVEPAIEG